jgi:hypothetical protein
MHDVIIVALIAASPSIIGIIMAFITRGAIREVHLSLNSRLDELVQASVDKGRIAERSDAAEKQLKLPADPPTIPL